MPNSEKSCHSSHKVIMEKPPVKAWTGQSYPAYKDSNMEWLGQVPEHWEVRRLKTLCDMRSGDAIAAMSINESGKYPVFGGNGIRGYAAHYTHNGNYVLIGRQGALCGNIHIARGRFWASEHAVVAMLRHRQHALEWFGAMLEAMNLNQYSIAAAQPGLAVDRVLNLWAPVPPAQEQHAIARFLDHANQRIQRHIHAKEKLIKLLEEQKQVIIHQAVTGQIDVRTGQPYPAYKESGVEWLEKVPEHWEVRRVKSLSLVKRGASPRPIADAKYFDEDGEYAWVRISDVTASEQYLENTTQRLSPLGQSLSVELQPGSLFLSIAGSVGKPMITRIKCCIHDGFVYFPQLKGSTEFLFRVFSCKAPFGRLGKFGTQLNLNTDTVGNICLGWPPQPERRRIVSFLDNMMRTSNQLLSSIRREVHLAHEYRTRLIADVVTGKLDVREAAAKLPGHEPPTTDNTCQDGMALAAQVQSRRP